MNNEKQKWWYGFDPNTFKYAGMRLSIEQPENATSIGIGDLINPVWDPSANKWTGDSMDDELKKMAEQVEAEKDDKADNEPLADLASVVADLQDTVNTSVSSLMTQVAQLQAKLDVTPASTDVAVDTTDDSATITAK